MSTPSTMDMSQPMSESYIHLSQDDTVDLSTTQDLTNTYHTNDLSMYMRMARTHDNKENHDDLDNEIPNNSNLRDSYDPSRSSISTKIDSDGSNNINNNHNKSNNNNDINTHDFQVSPIQSKTSNNTKYQNTSQFFSSHSTPLIPKTSSNYRFKHNRSTSHNRTDSLPNINEKTSRHTRNDEQAESPDEFRDESTLEQNDFIKQQQREVFEEDKENNPPTPLKQFSDESILSPSPQVQSSSNQFQVSPEELFKCMQPYLLADLNKFKDMIEDMFTKNNAKNSINDNKFKDNDKNVFITPIRNRYYNSTNESSNDDKLSLNGTSTGKVMFNEMGTTNDERNNKKEKKNGDNNDNSNSENDNEFIDNEDSPITTPPHSREMSMNDKEKSSFIITSSMYDEDQEFKNLDKSSDFEISYIPTKKHKKVNYNEVPSSKVNFNEVPNKVKHDDGKFNQLQIQINQLRKESEHLREDKKLLQKKIGRLEDKLNELEREDDKEEDEEESPIIDFPNLTSEKIDLGPIELGDRIFLHKKTNSDRKQSVNLEPKARSKSKSKSRTETKTKAIDEDERLRLENEQLRNENEYLRKINEQTRKGNERLIKDNERLARDNEQIRIENEQFKVKNKIHNNKLQVIKNDNEELNNEIKYLKNQLNINNLQNQEIIDKLNDRINIINKENNGLKFEIGNKDEQVTINSILIKFQEYYNRLKLSKIDKLTKVELGNILKNIMLSILISDFDNLPMNSAKIGNYLKITSRFFDNLHYKFYGDDEKMIKPSVYLKNNKFNEKLCDFETCLNGMMEKF